LTISPSTSGRRKAVCWALATTSVLAALIVVGSRNLVYFDAALVCYTFASLFATFGITYRYVVWLQRPPTALYMKRGRQLLLVPAQLGPNLLRLSRRLVADFVFNRFIWRRGAGRGLAHWLIMWGCLSALAITFPLVFGWVHFRHSLEGGVDVYHVHVFGFGADSFEMRSLLGFLVFHALVWSSLLVVAGVLLALRRRLREQGVAALQQFSEDFLPLLLLLAVSVTGLLLTASYTWMRGYAYDFLAILHAVVVIVTLLWLPFGKFFHVFVRPTHLAVGLYKDAGRQGEQARCRRCDQPFASRMHVEDLIAVERQLGHRYEAPGSAVEHYQWVCPACRRRLLALAQGALWVGQAFQPDSSIRQARKPDLPSAWPAPSTH
jgi:hypothetical protein